MGNYCIKFVISLINYLTFKGLIVKKILSILAVSIIGYVSANSIPPVQIESEYLKSESGVILIKKGSLLTQNNDGSFKIKNGCYIKYDNSKQKMIESCVH